MENKKTDTFEMVLAMERLKKSIYGVEGEPIVRDKKVRDEMMTEYFRLIARRFFQKQH